MSGSTLTRKRSPQINWLSDFIVGLQTETALTAAMVFRVWLIVRHLPGRESEQSDHVLGDYAEAT